MDTPLTAVQARDADIVIALATMHDDTARLRAELAEELARYDGATADVGSAFGADLVGRSVYTLDVTVYIHGRMVAREYASDYGTRAELIAACTAAARRWAGLIRPDTGD